MRMESSSNFREIVMGEIFPGILYRSSHPICDKEQVKDIVLAANNAKIKTIINFSDNNRSLKSKIIYSPWYKRIFDENGVIALGINMKFDIMEKNFLKKVKDVIVFMANHESPYLIHCEAGIDRTGFFSILLGSFVGAKPDEMAKDYMLSFVGNNGYSEVDHKNGILFLENLFAKIKGNAIEPDDDLQSLIIKYLTKKARINEDVLEALENKLTNNWYRAYHG